MSHQNSWNNQYRPCNVRFTRSHSLSSGSICIRFVSYGYCLLWILVLLWSYQTRSWATLPCCNFVFNLKTWENSVPESVRGPNESVIENWNKIHEVKDWIRTIQPPQWLTSISIVNIAFILLKNYKTLFIDLIFITRFVLWKNGI